MCVTEFVAFVTFVLKKQSYKDLLTPHVKKHIVHWMLA